MTPLACTHCGHRFELETPDGALCPSCGWSSSVVLAADLDQKQETGFKQSSDVRSNWIVGFLIFLLKAAAVVLAAGVLIGGIMWFLNREKPQSSEKVPSASSFLGGVFSKDKTTGAKSQGGVNLPAPEKIRPSALTSEEIAILNSKLDVPQKVTVRDEDLKLLQRAINLEAGNIEKLPSGSWGLDQFKEYVSQQEKTFKMPLPRGYKKDLEDLFEKTYMPAYELFAAGKIQESRDAYVASLAFPVYANDVRKHRAVVLTMFRSFLNDTIAKIGALNFALARRGIAGQAEQAGAGYALLQNHIRAENWAEAMKALVQLEKMLPDSALAGPAVLAPAYAADFAKVDADMQPTLLKLLQIPAWPFDVAALKGDLSVKKMILEPLTDIRRESSVKSYLAALEKIRNQAWPEAETFLKEVQAPDDLKRDADQKLEIIGKLISGERFLKAGV